MVFGNLFRLFLVIRCSTVAGSMHEVLQSAICGKTLNDTR